MKYSCLILTRNEADSIGGVIAQLREVFRSHGFGEMELVLSDDSDDGTAEIARGLGARVVAAGGRGLGNAYRVGLKACLSTDPGRVLVLDGDGQADLAEVPEFIRTMDTTPCDMVTGSRFLDVGLISYRYRKINRFGVWCLSAYLSGVTGQRFTDSHGGLRLLTAELAQAQTIYGSHTYVQESIVDAVARGFRVREIPSRWLRREHGGSKVVRSVTRYAWRTFPWLAYRGVWAFARRFSS